MKYCPVCNRECGEAANFCPECGAALAGTPHAENAGAFDYHAEETIQMDRADLAGDGGDGNVRADAAGGPGGSAPQPAKAQNAAGPAGGAPANQAIPQKIEDHMVKSIITIFCCCPPFGVIALIYAMNTKAELKANNFGAALEASKKANLWSNLAIALGLLWAVLYFVFIFSAVGEGGLSGYFSG